MPCQSDYLQPTDREQESRKVLDLLKEVGIKTGPTHDLYGRLDTIDRDTALLCKWCKANDVTKKSLELQIWWRDHQKADAKRRAAQQALERQTHLKLQALAKLSKEEREALDL